MMCACHAVPLFGAPDTFIRVGKPGPRTQWHQSSEFERLARPHGEELVDAPSWRDGERIEPRRPPILRDAFQPASADWNALRMRAEERSSRSLRVVAHSSIALTAPTDRAAVAGRKSVV